jgi:preprotein translocase SecE subunit
MAVQEDVKRGSAPTAKDNAPAADGERAASSSDAAQEGAAPDTPFGAGAPNDKPGEAQDVAEVGAAAPMQLGTRRFVYAAYFAGAIAIAFLGSKVFDFAWLKLQSYKPAVGEPRDEVVMPASALLGVGAALYYWNRTRARQLAEEVATEMSKVTWPTRTEVTNGTVVVIVTTIVSTVFFALMDKFWGFVTNLVYGGT